MSPKYKLTYFKVKGRGEPIRLLLAYGKQEFEDNFVEKDAWSQMKLSVPFGKLPILEVDGKVFHQSLAICRYLAKKFGLAGTNDEEFLQIEAAVDTWLDFATEVRKYMQTKDEEEKAAVKKNLLEVTFPYYASKFEEIVKANGGYFVGGKLSWADIYFATSIEGLIMMLGAPDLLKQYPQLKAVQKKVFEEPNIKAWLAKRKPF